MFSLSWFTTIPGLLITGGVLLLVVALIIFIVTSKKDKNKNNDSGAVAPNNGVNMQAVTASNQAEVVQPTTQPVLPVTNQAVAVMPINTTISVPEVGSIEDNAHSADLNSVPPVIVNPMPVQNDFQNISVPPVPTVSPVVETPAVTPINNNVEVSNEAFNIPTVTLPDVNNVTEVNATPYMSSEVTPVDNVVVNSTTPEISAVSFTQPEEVPTYPAMTPEVVPTNIGISNETAMPVPSIEQVVPEMQDVAAPAITANTVPTSIEEPVSIYGGAVPVIPSINTTENHQIYGGANPLENTQSVPITAIASEINNINTEPVVDSVVAPVPAVSTPEVPTVSIPDVNYNQSSFSAVPNIPASPIDMSTISTPQVEVPNYTAQQQSYVPEQGVPINNNFQYQSATAPQIQVPTDNMQ